MRAVQGDITELQRRIGRLPDRISAAGREVADWNDAVDAGFYWSEGALNSPSTDPIHAGYVVPLGGGFGPRVLQEVSFPSATTAYAARTWRRIQAGGAWGSWFLIQGATDWVDLQSYLDAGITYVADGDAAMAGIRARRIGTRAAISLGNFMVDTMSVPASGNITNRGILLAIPAEYRPATGVPIGGGWAGRVWQGYVRPNGTVLMSAVSPDATATGTATWTDQTYSGSVEYEVATP